MKKAMMCVGVACLSACVLAAVNDTLISFSTPGPDTYADGSVVVNGECYALVWSADGVFEGVKDDGTAVDENDRVVLVSPLARDGKCPPMVFQVNAAQAQALANGQFAVYLLDTRRTVDGTVVAGFEPGANVPPFVKSYAAATEQTCAGDASMSSFAATKAVDGASLAQAVEIASPRVAIQVKNASIKLTVLGMSPAADYWVERAAAVKGLSEKIADVPATGVVEVPQAPEAGFFQVKGALKQ